MVRRDDPAITHRYFLSRLPFWEAVNGSLHPDCRLRGFPGKAAAAGEA
jgi:hypothetical protein